MTSDAMTDDDALVEAMAQALAVANGDDPDGMEHIGGGQQEPCWRGFIPYARALMPLIARETAAAAAEATESGEHLINKPT